MPFDNAQGTLPRWLAFLLALSERNESKCAPAATRTRNLKVKSFLLYQLSYGGLLARKLEKTFFPPVVINISCPLSQVNILKESTNKNESDKNNHQTNHRRG